jgi:Protease inhibitor Inh
MRLAPIVGLLLPIVFCAGAAAQTEPVPPPQLPPGDTGRSLVGGWELSNADHDRTCTITFKTDAGQGGSKLELDPSCASVFPLTKPIVAWKFTPRDVLQLIDARGRAAIEFSEVETGMYEAERPEGIYFLQSLDSLGPPPPTTAELVGEWTILRGEKLLCQVTLSNTAFDQDSFVLTLKPGCDAAVTRFGLSSWHLDRGELLLVSPRGVWRFEEIELTNWHRVPETSEPTMLVRVTQGK